MPLALNRAPAADLEPWIARVMVAMADARDDSTQTGYLCNDAAYVRTAIGADWTVETADGRLEIRDETFLCGQHSKAWKLLYRGPVIVAGFMLKPGAMRAIWGVEDGTLVDRIRPMAHIGVADSDLTDIYRKGIEGEDWLCQIETWLRDQIRQRMARPPARLSQKFEEAAFADPNIAPGEFCGAESLSLRRLQRVCKRDFGLTPKQVLRRARVLDLAARMCGVADEAEETEFLLRYFDQSHQIRDFSAFFGSSPRQFMDNRQPLLTLSLEIRQARRLELLDRIAPDAVRPWMRQQLVPAVSRTAS